MKKVQKKLMLPALCACGSVVQADHRLPNLNCGSFISGYRVDSWLSGRARNRTWISRLKLVWYFSKDPESRLNDALAVASSTIWKIA